MEAIKRCTNQMIHTISESTVTQKAGYWGTLAVCDIPSRTLKNMLENIRKLEKVVNSIEFYCNNK